MKRHIYSGLRDLYLKVGLHTAPRGTLLYHLHSQMVVWVFGQKSKAPKLKTADLPDPAKEFVVAFCISGGIGDYLLSARYIRDFLAAVGNVSFDIYSARPSVTQWIFGAFPQFRKQFDERYINQSSIARHYPVVLRAVSFIDVMEKIKEPEKLAASNPSLAKLCHSVIGFNAKLSSFIDFHPRFDGAFAEVAIRHGYNRMTFLQGASGIAYGGDLFPVATDEGALEKFALTGRRYITIHNGHDTEFHIHGSAVGAGSTKTWPHFAVLVALLKKKYPTLTIVQFGSKTSTPIAGVDVNLIDRTTLPECAEILKHSLLHIDGESGLVHLAACFGTRSVVIFGPTSVEFFGYPQNINIRPTFCGNCWWMTNDWLKNCMRGFDEPRCMTEQNPETVAAIIIDALKTEGDTPVKVPA